MAKDKKYSGLNIIGMIGNSFRGCSKPLRAIIGFLMALIVIIPFFYVSNWREGLVAAICTIILLILSCIRREWGKWLCGIWSVLLIIHFFVTALFVGSPFGGFLSNEHVMQKNEEVFHTRFAKAIYEMSIRDYENSLNEFEMIKSIVPEEYLLEYYLWYGETAMYAGENELSINIFKEAQNCIADYDMREKEILFKIIPIAEMTDYLNSLKYDELEEMANQYQNTNEQIYYLFELVALCDREDIEDYEDRIKELLILYPTMRDDYGALRYLKNDLMDIIFWCLYEEYPEYSLILMAQMFEEDKSFFYERNIFVYPEGNPMNMRWFSIDHLRTLREMYEDGWNMLQIRGSGEFEQYMPAIENLGYYLGVDSFMTRKLEEQGKKWDIDDEFLDWELYNVIPLEDNKYFGIWLETTETGMASVPHFYTFNFDDDGQIHLYPIEISELTAPITMSKLFLAESTREKDKVLMEYIIGTGEYLNLGVLDISDGTYEVIENPTEMYHTSDFMYDVDSNSYTACFEINNSIDPNMISKVGGKVTAEINLDRNIVYSVISYPDPAVEFYVEQRNDALVLPLQNLNKLSGRDIKNEVLLEKIRENSIPYYKNSLIQHCYSYMMGIVQGKLSGITIVYDYGTEEEASFFYYVKRDGDEIQLMGIYQIIDDELHSVY